MNKNLTLIDTSVWISYFRGTSNAALTKFVADSLSADLAAVSEIIKLELLRGAKNEKEFNSLKMELDALHLLETDDKVWECSNQLGFELRKKGLKIPSTDLLIAAGCLESEGYLLHDDQHFEFIAKYSNLRTLPAKKFT